MTRRNGEEHDHEVGAVIAIVVIVVIVVALGLLTIGASPDSVVDYFGKVATMVSTR